MDNTTQIAAIRAILESGVSSVTVDGMTTNYDLVSLRKELARLMAEDDNYASRRPRVASIDLSGY